MQMCVSGAFSLALYFVLSYSDLFLFNFIICLDACLFFNRSKKERVWIVLCEEVGRSWKQLREEKA